MENLPADAFANMIYWVFISALVLIISYYLEKVFQHNREWFYWVIFFPPCIPIMVIKYWERYRAATFFFFIYIVLLVLAGVMTGTDLGIDTYHLLLKFIFWPFFLGKWLAYKFYFKY